MFGIAPLHHKVCKKCSRLSNILGHISTLPGKVRVVPAEMPVFCSLPEDGAPQIKCLNNTLWSQVEMLAGQSHNIHILHLTNTESIDHNSSGLGDGERIEVRRQAHSRQAFTGGELWGLPDGGVEQSAGVYGVADVLGLGSKVQKGYIQGLDIVRGISVTA